MAQDKMTRVIVIRIATVTEQVPHTWYFTCVNSFRLAPSPLTPLLACEVVTIVLLIGQEAAACGDKMTRCSDST